MTGGEFIYSMEMTRSPLMSSLDVRSLMWCVRVSVCVFACANVPAVSLMVIYCFAAQGLFYSPLHLFDHMLV